MSPAPSIDTTCNARSGREGPRTGASRKPKTLWTANAEGEAITRYVASDERDEARFVVDEIERLLAVEHRSYADFAKGGTSTG